MSSIGRDVLPIVDPQAKPDRKQRRGEQAPCDAPEPMDTIPTAARWAALWKHEGAFLEVSQQSDRIELSPHQVPNECETRVQAVQKRSEHGFRQ
ncbi:hypothetical protein ACFP3O_35465 [Paraburkholderia silvatlantica]|uniref:hypothetical protein n=1 Tax=Paraburkholderia silvatlantica TaxID=321895 RepID=UPI001060EB13|nr:hypothetical protein [Paraburkholderia silvatlantica]